jgi:hypothetical protein
MITNVALLLDADCRTPVAGPRRSQRASSRRATERAVGASERIARRCCLPAVLALGLVMASGADAAAQPNKPLHASLQVAGPAPEVPANGTPLERQPYRIRLMLVFDDQGTFTAHFRRWLVDNTAALIRRTIGDPWQGEVLEGGAQLRRFFDEGPNSAGEELSQVIAADVDKVLLVRLGAAAGGYQLSAREYDVATRQWGPRRSSSSAIRNLLDRKVLELCLAIFAPLAKPAPQEQPGSVQLTLKAGALVTADPTVRLVEPDAVFGLIRLFHNDRAAQAQVVDWTYLVVQRVDAGKLSCRLLSAYRSPTTGRAPGSELLAMRLRPAPAPARFRFLNREGKPLAGYEVHVSDAQAGSNPRLFTTDFRGSVTLPSADRLLSVALRSGTQTLVRLWVLTGALSEQQDVVVPDDPVRFQVESRLAALQDAIIDEVALRTLTIRRVQALMDRDEWKRARAAMNRLSSSSAPFQSRLDQARADALRLAQERGSESLSPGVKAMLDETQNYIDVLLQSKPVNDLHSEFESRYRAFQANSSG